MKLYKVLDLSYSDDPAQHLKEVGAYQEGEGWRLLSVLRASGRWLYYLERDADPSPGSVAAAAVGGESSLPEPVRRVEGGGAPALGTLDYLTLGLARFREVAEAGGFEVGEVTLSFDEVEDKALLKVSLRIDAALLEAEPARAGGGG